MFDTLYTQLNGTIATLGKCGNLPVSITAPIYKQIYSSN